MATTTELANAINVIKKHCIDHQKQTDAKGNHPRCIKCVLRNSDGLCGLFNRSGDYYFDSPEEWDVVNPDIPKLFTY